MALYARKCLLNSSISSGLFHASSKGGLLAFSSVLSSPPGSVPHKNPGKLSDFEILLAKVGVGRSDDEVLESLVDDQQCSNISLSHNLIHRLLHYFNDDWKSALGVFRWAELHSDYRLTSDAYDLMLDILGKMKQMDKMMYVLKQMQSCIPITLNTVAKIMRRFAGAGKWEDAARIFDSLETYGLKKDTESMNLLLDTLCKENMVEQAREIFTELRPHISPNAHTFNIFIHGWCKLNRVDEAHWTIQEMKGHGCKPCVISYSTIIQFYCRQCNSAKVYELLDEMENDGCPPNVVTYTTVMCYLTKSSEYRDALKVAERMKSFGCKPDTLFYNSLIYTLGRAGQLQEAIRVYDVEMPQNDASPSTSTYNTMISMFCYHGEEEKALIVLDEMEKSALCKPDAQTFYPLLKACFKTGKADSNLRNLLDDIVKKHHLSLDLSTYTLLIHGHCRVNNCEWAYNLFEEMISKDIIPRYKTCRLLYKELKEKQMYNAADRLKDVMKNL